MGEPLAEPALDALRGHDDEFLGERIGEGVSQQGAEPVGEEIGALGTVEVKCHRLPR